MSWIDWRVAVTCVDVQDCIERKLCRVCLLPLVGRQTAYCSQAHADEFNRQHFWGSANHAARRRAGHKCETCGAADEFLDLTENYSRSSLEVNHKRPLRGSYRSVSCHNHADNLEVLCHDCHVMETERQFRPQKAMARDLQLALEGRTQCS